MERLFQSKLQIPYIWTHLIYIKKKEKKTWFFLRFDDG